MFEGCLRTILGGCFKDHFKDQTMFFFSQRKELVLPFCHLCLYLDVAKRKKTCWYDGHPIWVQCSSCPAVFEFSTVLLQCFPLAF